MQSCLLVQKQEAVVDGTGTWVLVVVQEVSASKLRIATNRINHRACFFAQASGAMTYIGTDISYLSW